MTNEEFLTITKNAGLTAEYYMTNPPRLSGFVVLDENRKFRHSLRSETVWGIIEAIHDGVPVEMIQKIAEAAKTSK